MKPQVPIRPFPARVPPLPGESLTSLLRRTAAAMGYNGIAQMVALLKSQGRLPPHLNELAPGQVSCHLAALLRLSSESLASLTVHHYAAFLMLVSSDRPPAEICDSKTILRYFSSSWPVCPVCLRQDAVPYERLLWSFRPVPVCTEHGCLLLFRCPACQRPLRWDRPNVLYCRCGVRLADIEPHAVSAQAVLLAGWYVQILQGDVPPLPGMSVPACLWWAERMAVAVSKTPDWLTEVGLRIGLEPKQHGDAIAWLAAAEILGNWPARLTTFLDAFQQFDKHRSSSTGLRRRFGMLLRHASWLENLGWSPPADTLRQYLLEHYSGGHLSGKLSLFNQSKDRPKLRDRLWVSQSKATKMLRVQTGTVAKLVRRGLLSGKVHPVGNSGRTIGVVLRASVEALQKELHEAMDVVTVSRRLGIGRHSVLGMIRRGMLRRAVRTNQGLQIPRDSVAPWENLCENLAHGECRPPAWISLRQATHRFGATGLTLFQLLEWIQAGKVAARMAQPAKALNGIAVSQADLAALAPQIRSMRDEAAGYPLTHLGKILFSDRPVKTTVLKKWIAAGLLKTRKSGQKCFVAPEEVARFRSQYCLAEEACRQLDIARATLYHWELEGLVQPVYGRRVTPGAGYSLYCREDLNGLTRRRRRRAA